MTFLRSFARFLAIAALLLAQQTALSHPLRHLDGQAGDPKQERLCDFHGALGSVLGAIGASHNAIEAVVCSHPATGAERQPAASIAAPTPSSRDPPQAL